MTADATRIGRVVSVTGSQVICMLEGSSSVDAALVQTGAMVKMETAHSIPYGLVRGVSAPMAAAEGPESEVRVVEIELIGEALTAADAATPGFQRGVSFFPALGSTVFLASKDDLRQIYACPRVATAHIGSVHQDESLPAYIKIDDLLGKHFAILGTTGSGKSCAVTVILKAILSEAPHSRILLLDPHDEYAEAFGHVAQVLDPGSTLELPYWLFSFDELCEVVVGADTDLKSAQTAILADAIVAARSKFSGQRPGYPLTVDTPVPYWISEVIASLQEVQGRLARPEALPAYTRLISRLKALTADSRYAFMFGRSSAAPAGDKMREILAGLFRIPIAGKPITIVDLSAVPSEILNVVVSVLCRMTFDFALWSDSKLPMLIVCEEAHRYAPRNSNSGFLPTKRVLGQIAKEGRKYGVSLCVVSQRPSDLASNMLSECNTIFALRMSNQADQDFVRAATAESGVSLLEFLSSLRTGEAIAIGEGVPVPLRVSFNPLAPEQMPRSKSASFAESWRREIVETDWVAAVIERWRRRQRGTAQHGPHRAAV